MANKKEKTYPIKLTKKLKYQLIETVQRAEVIKLVKLWIESDSSLEPIDKVYKIQTLDEFNSNSTQYELSNYLLNNYLNEDNFTNLKLAQLDLLKYIQNQTSTKYNLFKLKLNLKPIANLSLNPSKLRITLNTKLLPFFNQSVYSTWEGDKLWVRIGIDEVSGFKEIERLNRVIMVVKVGTPYLIMSKVPPKLEPYLIQVLKEVFEADEIQQKTLQSKNLATILTFLTNPSTQTKLKPLEFNTNKFELFNELNPINNINLLNIKQTGNFKVQEFNKLNKNLNFIKSSFGDHKLSKLESCTLITKTSLPSTDLHQSIPFESTLTFNGPSVLEGLKQLNEQNIDPERVKTSKLPFIIDEIGMKLTNEVILE
ncbi:hypothetical protein CONCODRAFT_20493 [Conidiobolus coronatus NRRL 28638]|uniref:Uncharacterized protein n=1 Tax=Conidiobolus coronatus (strain ATCC 28846 / CBS 209.66 / NRRL 28638) TaxID=796925 RepID=A0A137NTK2_CONC2|nr:hypothetical protein CONCODRAFT_20493 [Conidiobolus coronatus NRRL 28638]|eukprot:KXN65954.1 hypothetical protein CONCODRAFT_20493 [Conidiobolus coronatus NRRL 28638]